MKKCPSYAFPYYGGKATHLGFILPHPQRGGCGTSWTGVPRPLRLLLVPVHRRHKLVRELVEVIQGVNRDLPRILAVPRTVGFSMQFQKRLVPIRPVRGGLGGVSKDVARCCCERHVFSSKTHLLILGHNGFLVSLAIH